VKISPSLLLIIALASSSSIAAQQSSHAKDDSMYVRVTASDPQNRTLAGLARERFRVSENNQPLEITYFNANEGPATVALLMDLSGSMTGKPRTVSFSVANKLLRRLPASTEYVIIQFHKEVSVICEACNVTAATKALNDISQSKERFGTVFYDAYEIALKKLEASRRTNRAVIVFSDGMETGDSKLSFQKLREALKNSEATSYSISSPNNLAGRLAEEGANIVKELSEITGGRDYYLKEEKQTDELADVIAAQINYHYLIGFKPLTATPDQKWHSIKIKLDFPRGEKPPKVDLRYRHHYFSR